MDKTGTQDNNSYNTSYPVQSGDIIEISIAGLTHLGEGVGRHHGVAVFVPFAVPGDRVKVQIEEAKRNYARGSVIEQLSSSDYRTENQCLFYGDCGCCHLQHYDYSQQLVFKQDIVRNALQRIGKVDGIEVLPTIGMEKPFWYRNKAEYPVKFVDGVFKSGFFASSSNRLVALGHSCPLQHPLLEKTRESLMVFCNQRETQKVFFEAGLHQLIIRCGQKTGEVMVIFVVDNPLNPIALHFVGGALSQLMALVPEVVSVYQKVIVKGADKKGSTNRNVTYELMEGKPYIREMIYGLYFDISPGSFFQVNSHQAEILFSKTVEYANCKGTAIDAYCGTGSISLFLAQQAEKVYGIESFPASIEDARHNAEINKVKNAEFVLGDSGKVLAAWKKDKPEAVVIDPPRAGCDARALEGIVLLKPKRIVYVSCNPATLARDLKFLVSKGYSVAEVQPIDMFPQTYHVECVTLMSRVEK